MINRIDFERAQVKRLLQLIFFCNDAMMYLPGSSNKKGSVIFQEGIDALRISW